MKEFMDKLIWWFKFQYYKARFSGHAFMSVPEKCREKLFNFEYMAIQWKSFSDEMVAYLEGETVSNESRYAALMYYEYLKKYMDFKILFVKAYNILGTDKFAKRVLTDEQRFLYRMIDLSDYEWVENNPFTSGLVPRLIPITLLAESYRRLEQTTFQLLPKSDAFLQTINELVHEFKYGGVDALYKTLDIIESQWDTEDGNPTTYYRYYLKVFCDHLFLLLSCEHERKSKDAREVLPILDVITADSVKVIDIIPAISEFVDSYNMNKLEMAIQ